jgi:O-antigen/teichoic acid export membrane protein
MASAYSAYKLLQFGSSLLLGIVVVRSLGRGDAYFNWESLLAGTGIWAGIVTFAQNSYFAQSWKPGHTLHAHWRMGTQLGLLAAAGWLLWQLLYPWVPSNWVLPGALWVFAAIAGQDAENALLKSRKSFLLLSTGSLFFGLQLGITALLWQGQVAIEVVVWGLALTHLLRYMAFSAVVAMQWPPSPAVLSWHQFVPLLGVALVSTGTIYADKLLVRWLDTPWGFQLYSVAARELPITLILANALSLAWAGRIADNPANVPTLAHNMRRETTRLMHLLFPLSWALMGSSTLLFGWVYKQEFAQAAPVFNLYLLLVIPRLLLPQAILIGLRENGTVLRVAIAESAMHVLLTLALVPLLGYAGAAWATLAAYVLDKALLVRLLQRKHPEATVAIPWQPWLLYSGLTISLWALLTFA